jgi:LCP family protein required for cell wall assembly
VSTATTPPLPPIAPAPAAPPPTGAPPPGTPPLPAEPPRRGWWIAKRFLLGALAVVVVSAAATALMARNEIGQIVEAFHQNKQVKVASDILAPTSSGAPETLLLVGNDERKLTQYYHHEVLPHSNEMLLVRIDPSKPTIAMLSIPRELQVPIDKPDGETEENRINAAYTYGWENGGGTAGGVKLMLQTIKRVLGLTVNHVFVTNFTKFEHAVDDMGCVYMTVDKRYYHSNSEPGAEQYMEINLQPGYQRVCGQGAREFVSNRHESTSLIRDARDQRFLLEIKAQYGPSIFEERERFEHIFGKYVESTLAGEEEILQLLYLLAESAGKPVRQVPFHVNLGPTLDTATPTEIHEAVHTFLTGTTEIHHQRLNVGAHAGHAHHHAAAASTVASGLDLSPTPSVTLDEARALEANVPFAVQAPLYQRTTAESEPDEMRSYTIHGPHDHRYPAYVIVVGQGELGQYYDIQGTTWSKPPLLRDASNTLTLGPRTYSLVYDGEHLKTVAWSEGRAVYWIENTLTNNLTPQQMVEIARETRPLNSAAGAQAARGIPPAPPSTRGLNVPLRTVASAGTLVKIGALLGFGALAVVALLALRVFTRQRELHTLREQVARALLLEQHQRPLLAAAGVTQAPAAPRQVAPVAMPAPGVPPRPAPPTAGSPSPVAPSAGELATAGPRPAESPRNIYRARRGLRSRRRDSNAGPQH